MAREFGKRSYKPENMDFVTSGSMPGTLPNSVMERALSRNILLGASENPSTIAELSMALGVAAPYMEEVQLLLKATLRRVLPPPRSWRKPRSATPRVPCARLLT